jgi:hypothetical protein
LPEACLAKAEVTFLVLSLVPEIMFSFRILKFIRNDDEDPKFFVVSSFCSFFHTAGRETDGSHPNDEYLTSSFEILSLRSHNYYITVLNEEFPLVDSCFKGNQQNKMDINIIRTVRICNHQNKSSNTIQPR